MSTLTWRKTKLCKFNVMGFCTKGRTCNFAHGASELANMTPPTPLSSTANVGMQTATSGCTSLPWDSDARAAVFPVMPKKKFHKTKICSFFVAGCCKKGSRCNFAHCTNELQPPPEFDYAKIYKVLPVSGSCRDPSCLFAHSIEDLEVKHLVS